jgi:hypothetical protein
MLYPAISSTFDFEGLSRAVLSVILSYVDINSVQNMLLVSNLFYFGIRDCLTHCHESVFEIYRTSFIGQLLPLFIQVEKLDDKIDILQILCRIHSNSVDHVLDPLSIANTFNPGWINDTSFSHQFGDLIYGLYPFASCFTTREYYYLLRPFILSLIPPTILLVDPLKPFESAILSNKFSFAHFCGYMNSFLPLMKKADLTASVLGINKINIRDMFCSFSDWNNIKSTMDERMVLFNLCLMDMSCVLLLLKDPLTSKQFNTIIERVLADK